METKKKVIPIIAMDHVSKQYSTGVEALSDVSICIHKGEFVFVVGIKVDLASPLLLNCF